MVRFTIFDHIDNLSSLAPEIGQDSMNFRFNHRVAQQICTGDTNLGPGRAGGRATTPKFHLMFPSPSPPPFPPQHEPSYVALLKNGLSRTRARIDATRSYYHLRSLCEALRDILNGKAWNGAPCKLTLSSKAVAMKNPFEQEFCTSYHGFQQNEGKQNTSTRRLGHRKQGWGELLTFHPISHGQGLGLPDTLKLRGLPSEDLLKYLSTMYSSNIISQNHVFLNIFEVGLCIAKTFIFE